MKSRKSEILEIFFNYPSKHWSFGELEKKLDIAQSKLAKWLKILQKQKIILKIKEKGKMPYYISYFDHPNYKFKKKIFALEKLEESGFLNHMFQLEKTNSIIIFGSFSRSDWYNSSDIDIFIYGNPPELNIGKYEKILHRDIQIFLGHNKKDLKKMGPGLLRNIIKGDLIKGDIPKEMIEIASI